MKPISFLRICLFVALLPVAGFAQDGDSTDDDTIKAIAEQACDCTREISVNLPKDSIVAKINSCITTQIFMQQFQEKVGTREELAAEATAQVEERDTTIADTVKITKNIMIVADKDFNEIQQYMRLNCTAVKQLMATNNVALGHSMSKNKKALKFYKEGQDYDAREQYNLALVSYNKAVDIDPKFAFAWDNLGLTYRKMGNYKEAIKCYEKSLELDPSSPTPLMNMGVAYTMLEDYASAAKTYDKYIEVHPDDPEGYYGGGKAYYLTGDYAKGVDYMFKAYKLYGAANSPYITDAKIMVQGFYKDLKEKGKLDVFFEAAKNNNIDIKE